MTTRYPQDERSGTPTQRLRADMTTGRAVMLVIAAVACVVAPVLVAVDAPPWVRFPAVLTLFCVGPGTALLGLLTPAQRPLDLGLVVATSLALSTLSAQTMLWLRAWSPDTFLMVVAAVSLVALVVELCRGR